MDQNSYQGKLAQLVEIFQGDDDYAKIVLDKWLQKNRSEFEAQILEEVRRRLEGLNSIVPVTLRVLIDQSGVHYREIHHQRQERSKALKKNVPAARKLLCLSTESGNSGIRKKVSHCHKPIGRRSRPALHGTALARTSQRYRAASG